MNCPEDIMREYLKDSNLSLRVYVLFAQAGCWWRSEMAEMLLQIWNIWTAV